MALPVIAIGAVVLTGGAALGALPAVGSMLGSVGIHGALAGILTTAGQGALVGALGSAVMGKDILKGASTGFLVGGALGGVNAALAGASTVANAGQAATQAAGTTGASAGAGAGAAGASGAASTAAGGIGSGVASSGATGAGMSMADMGIQSVASQAAQQAAVQTAAQAANPGLLGVLSRNPLLAGSLIQGIGSGLTASESRKAELEAQARRSANYAGYQGVGSQPTVVSGPTLAYDPTTGRIVQKVN